MGYIGLKVSIDDAVRKLDELVSDCMTLTQQIDDDYNAAKGAGQTGWQSGIPPLVPSWDNNINSVAQQIEAEINTIYQHPANKFNRLKQVKRHWIRRQDIPDDYTNRREQVVHWQNTLSDFVSEIEQKGKQVTYNVKQGDGSVFNAGTVAGNIQTNVTKIRNAGNGSIADALEKLTAAIELGSDDDFDRGAALSNLQTVSEAIVADPDSRNENKAKLAIQSLNLLGSVASIGSAIGQYLPIIQTFLGL
jgi:hypothetical protein